MSDAAKSKVFISYSRRDASFVDDLTRGLDTYGGFAVLIDREGIGHGEDWRSRLGRLILECDTMVFVLSPDSVASEICAWEVQEANALGRRIIPALYRAVDFDAAPPGLSALNAVPFTDGQIIRGLEKLVAALDTDMGWLREHTALTERAAEWERKGAPIELLLRGATLRGAQALLSERPASAPEPMERLRRYLRASEEEEARLLSVERARLVEMEAARDAAEAARQREGVAARQVVRRTVAGLVVALALLIASLAAGGFAYLQREEAQAQRVQAEAEAERADGEAERAFEAAAEARRQRDAALLIQSRFLARTAQEHLARGDVANALAFARRALPADLAQPDRPFAIEPVQAIFDAWGALREVATMRHAAWPLRPIALPEGRIATVADDGKLRFWAADGALEQEIDAHAVVASSDGDSRFPVRGMLALSDGRLVSWGEDKTVKFWSADGALLQETSGDRAARIRQFDDGRIAEFGADEIRIRGGDWGDLFSLKPAISPVNRLSLLPSGRFFARGGDRLRRGQIFEADGATAGVIEVEDGRILEVAELSDGRLVSRSEKHLQYWSADGEPARRIDQPFRVQAQGMLALSGGRLLAYGQDGFSSETSDPWLVKIFDTGGDEVRSFQIGSFPGEALQLSDGRIVLGATTNTPSIWSADFEPGPVLRTGEKGGGLRELDDGRLLSDNLDGSVRIWGADGRELVVFRGHERGAYAQRTPDGRVVSASPRDGSVRVWREDGRPVATVDLSGGVNRATPLSGGRAVFFANNAAELVDADGATLARLEHGDKPIAGVLELDDARLLSWAWGGREGAEGPPLRVWSAAGAPLGEIETEQMDVFAAAPTRDGGFATLGSDNVIRLHDGAGAAVGTALAGGPPIHRLLRLSDGRFVAAELTGRLTVLSPSFEPQSVVVYESDRFDDVRALDDGRVAVLADFRRVLQIVDAESGETIRLATEDAPFLNFAGLADGRTATVGFDRQLVFWDAAGAVLEAGDVGETGNVLSLSDGRLLVLREDETQIWDPAGRQAGAIARGGLRLDGAFATPDGWIVGWSDDAAYLWSADGSDEIALTGFDGDFSGVFPLSDGRLVGWGSFSAAARVWPGSVEQAIDWADAEIERLQPLTAAERCAYYLEPDDRCNAMDR